MGKKILLTIHKALELSNRDTHNAQLVRFSVVYVLLFIIMLCSSSGVFGQTGTRLSLETFEMKPVSSETPLFADFYVEKKEFKGKFEESVLEVQALVKARAEFIEKVKMNEYAEKTRLRAEHKSLMANSGSADNAKWGRDLYTNITQQAVLIQSTESKIAEWDKKNFLNVRSVNKKGKKYITAMKVLREKVEKKSAVASIP